MKSDRIDNGSYQIFTQRFPMGKLFSFKHHDRRRLTTLLDNKKWIPLRIDFSNIDFTHNGSDILAALNNRTDIAVTYTNCILLKKKTADNVADQSLNTTPEPEQKQEPFTTSQSTPFYNSPMQPAKATDIEKEKTNFNNGDDYWRQMSVTYYREALDLIKSELVYDIPQIEIKICKTLESFLYIQNKTVTDFEIVKQAISQTTYSEDPLFIFIYDLFSKQNNFEGWKMRFNELFVSAKNIYADQLRSFVINLIQYLLDTRQNSLFANESLCIYLNDAHQFQALSTQLSELKAIHETFLDQTPVSM